MGAVTRPHSFIWRDEVKLRAPKLREMLYWMHERQKIYLKRQAGEPWPWTKDPILQKYRMCNVYREQDRETVWLRTHWLKPYADHDNLWFSVCLFRLVNWSPTLQEVGFPETWEPKRVTAVMEDRKKRGEKVFTSAYMLPSHHEQSKAVYTVSRVLDPLWRAAHKESVFTPWDGSLQMAHERLTQFYGFGAFLAYEVVSDWRHTRYLHKAPDIGTWANSGPGARRGICRLLNVDLRTTISKAEQLEYMREVYAWVDENRDRDILPTLEMRDIEHSLCELSKYLRVKEALKSGGRYKGGLEIFRLPLVAVL